MPLTRDKEMESRLALSDRDFERLQAADLLHARNFMLQCAIRDAQRALERGDADAAMHALCRVEPQMGGLWQPIETALKDDCRMLMFDPQGGALDGAHDRFDPMYFVGYWDMDGWRDDVACQYFHPTHWAPLPPPPETPDVA